MIKIRSILVFALLPFVAGYSFATIHTQKQSNQKELNFNTGAILQNDEITIVNQGDIVVLSKNNTQQVTRQQQVIEAAPFGSDYIAIDKQTNYSSLLEFDQSGKLVKTILDGKTNNIDTMNWFTDPAVNSDQKTIAIISDKDKQKTNILDNALFIANTETGSIKRIVDPGPHTGGIAHPIWNPTDSNIIAYDNYQYDDSNNPYSAIMIFNVQTGLNTALTTPKQNAYQGAFSPDGKKFIFLTRNEDNTVSINLADFTNNHLANASNLASGDFAYPAFSNTPNHIYYLQAQGNNGYDLFTATIENNSLKQVTALSQSEQLVGTSGFTVTSVSAK